MFQSFPFPIFVAFAAPGSLPAAAGGALPLGLLVWAGSGGHPVLLEPDVPHVWDPGALHSRLPLGGQRCADPGELWAKWVETAPFPHFTAGFGFKEFIYNGLLWAGFHISTGTSLSLLALSLSVDHLHLWLWNISCPLRLFNGLQISHGTKQSSHLVFNLHFGK